MSESEVLKLVERTYTACTECRKHRVLAMYKDADLALAAKNMKNRII